MRAPLRPARPTTARLVLGALLLALVAACGGTGDDRRDGDAKEHRDTRPTDSRAQADRAEREARKHRRDQPRKRERHPPKGAPLRDPVIGADVSWPQCPRGMGIPERRSEGKPMPRATARYVVVGLTNGPGFTRNPCLADQLEWVRTRGLPVSVYAVLSWPGPDRPGGAQHDGPYDADTRHGRLRNAGYAQASYNIATLQRHHVETPAVWVDVEPYPVFPWSADPAANAQVVRGAVRAYRDAGLRVGIYSTPHLWRTVVGDLHLGVPEWRAAGQTSYDVARSRCGPQWSIQGGPAVLAQWTDGTRDHNTTCPHTASELDQWFHRP